MDLDLATDKLRREDGTIDLGLMRQARDEQSLEEDLDRQVQELMDAVAPVLKKLEFGLSQEWKFFKFDRKQAEALFAFIQFQTQQFVEAQLVIAAIQQAQDDAGMQALKDNPEVVS